jgi:quinol monooxygenase YgiN
MPTTRGCLLYALQVNPADENQAFMIEKWESVEHLQAHGGADKGAV